MLELPKLSAAEITAILNKPKRHRSSKNTYWIRDADGNLLKVTGKPRADQVGSFVGNVGSTVRSRKGRSYRLANGSRTYISGDLPEVVMY